MPGPAHLPISRRSAVRQAAAATAAIALPMLWLGPRAQPPGQRLLTPAQTEGPFYPLSLPADTDNDLLQQGPRSYRHGLPAWVSGSVTDPEGRPVRGASVEIWQCDHAGRYHHPGDGNRADPDFQGFGRMTVNELGEWRFRTIRPVRYGTRAPHIHVKVKLGLRELLTTQIYVEGDPTNERDSLWRSLRSEAERAALTVPFRPTEGGLLARFPIVVTA